MNSLFILFTLCFSLSSLSAEPSQNWEALDLEEEHQREIEKQQMEYEDREGDLQIQAEEEEIIPLESEDSRYFNNSQSDTEED